MNLHDREGADPRRHWERVYVEKAEQEVSWFQEVPAISMRLVAATGVGPDARIVDVGGGASRLVDALLVDGYGRLTVLDLAAPALERARQRLGSRAASVSWVAADVTSWRPDGTFDVWHDRAVFHFLVRPEERAAYRSALLRALRAGGHAIVATFAADGPERCSGLPVARYDPDALAVELGPELRLVESLREEHRTPGGKVQRFQYSRFVRS
jgi:ubiquinone/menaquinone biosynthesis C-methylase UbiE